MKREWQVHHAVAEYSDGQRRWDYAYQFLLRWMMEETAEPSSQEDENENCPLCPSIDQPPISKSKH
jgi:hypothetical protein